jgi:hypothetical protein
MTGSAALAPPLYIEANFFMAFRILVSDRKQIVLTPIEVSIEDIQLKVAKLDAAIKVRY